MSDYSIFHVLRCSHLFFSLVQFFQLLLDTSDTVVHGTSGTTQGFRHLVDRHVGEVHVRHLLVAGRQLLDKVVESLHQRIGRLLGKGFAQQGVELHQPGPAFLLAAHHTGRIERDHIDPRRLSTRATKTAIALPQVGDNLLIEVIEGVGTAVGEHQAHLHYDALTAGEHRHKILL